MFKFNNKLIRYFVPLVLILLLSLTRLVPHPWNFTPMLAAGIFSGFYFRQFFLGSLMILVPMFLGDLYLGFHNTMIFVYISLAISVSIGLLMKNFKAKVILLSGLSSSVCFFLITNFGAWLTLDIYEKTFYGLINSYFSAIPFFHNTLLSTLIYLFLLKIFVDFAVNKKVSLINY
tara:strand:- start:789 stop:1313 length:525 start_codon:yes stop_codon:yes gene_type:complete